MVELCSLAAVSIFCYAITGCGSSGKGVEGGGSVPPQNPGFALSISPSSVDLNQQGASQPVQISITAQGGFTGSVNVSADTLPAGVAVSPSSLALSAGIPGTVNISASSAAQISQQTIAFKGTSGTLSANSSVQVTIMGGAVADPFHYVGGSLVHGFYDESRQLLFVTNLRLNELDVVSGVDYSVKARIPVPQPIGIDQMADGHTLVLGSAAQELVTVDENTYAVATHPFSETAMGAYSLFFPTVVAMANGKVFAIGQEQGIDSNDIVNGGQTLFEWDTNADTFTQIVTSEIDRLARSGDHKWAVFSADQFYLYNSDADSFTTAPLSTVDPPDDSFGVRGYAVNADGSKIAVASASQVSFFDRSFDLLGTVQIRSAFQSARSAVRFSGDGTKLYLQYAFPLALVEVDVGSLSSPGYFSATVNPDGDNLEGLLAIDAEGHAYFNIDGGVRLVNLSQTPVPNTSNGALNGPSCGGLNAIVPLDTTQQIQGVQPISGGNIYVGGQPATISSGGTVVTVPASATAGPAHVECIDSAGNTTVTAQAVSYGVDPVGLSASLLPPTGYTGAYVFGFGFAPSAGSQETSPVITVGNSPAPKVYPLQEPGAGVLEGDLIQIPTGTAGEGVNVGVSSSLGTGTLQAAATYYPVPTIMPASGILQLTFDTHRNRLYALKATEIDVLDGASLEWLPPLAFPSGFTGTAESMGITPDGSTLAVLALVGSQPEMVVVDLTGGAPAVVTAYTGYENSSFLTGSMALTNQNTAIIVGLPILVFDVATHVFTPVAPPDTFTMGQVLRASADGTRVYGAQLNITSGTIYSINPTTLVVSSEGFGESFWTDLAVSPDGSRFAAVDAPPFSVGDFVGFFNSSLQYVNANAFPDYSIPDNTGVLGVTYSPGGKVLVVPLGDSIELWDANTGQLRDRLMTPEELQVLVYPENAVAPVLAVNAAGDTIFAVSAHGLSVIPLPGPMDQMSPRQWSEYRSVSGMSAALRGNLAMRMKAMVRPQAAK